VTTGNYSVTHSLVGISMMLYVMEDGKGEKTALFIEGTGKLQDHLQGF
jgi:hypothetical protein